MDQGKHLITNSCSLSQTLLLVKENNFLEVAAKILISLLDRKVISLLMVKFLQEMFKLIQEQSLHYTKGNLLGLKQFISQTNLSNPLESRKQIRLRMHQNCLKCQDNNHSNKQLSTSKAILCFYQVCILTAKPTQSKKPKKKTSTTASLLRCGNKSRSQ